MVNSQTTFENFRNYAMKYKMFFHVPTKSRYDTDLLPTISFIFAVREQNKMHFIPDYRNNKLLASFRMAPFGS